MDIVASEGMIVLVKKTRSWKFAFTVTAVVAAGLFGVVGYSSVCTRCGMERDTLGWQFPLIPVTLAKVWWSSETPVSLLLKRTDLVAKHDHEWCFAAGNGNGSNVQWMASEQETAVLLEECLRFGDRSLADRLLRVMFDPVTAIAIRSLAHLVPEQRFADAADFEAWKDENLELFEREVAGLQERDARARERARAPVLGSAPATSHR
ncbi:MAG TPA: hypothetical protein VD994_03890, partial [Prosthecobacter sp.]|nr:hypothetical protein [Prosthecobacter sp.]